MASKTQKTMKSIHQIIRERLKVPLAEDKKSGFSLAQLADTQWSPEFESLMRNRLIMGALRYGTIGAQGKGAYDFCGSAIHRIKEYQRTGNIEHLVDAANLMLKEFTNGSHPNRHFSAVDDGEHTKETR